MITTLNEALAIAADARTMGRRIVTTNGCFDILHLGHLEFLNQAKALGDILLVLINSDESVRVFKGDGRPVLNTKERAEILRALRAVDHVLVFDEPTPLNILERLAPDFHVKGGSFLEERIAAERSLIERCGGSFKTFPMLGDLSSTNFMRRVLEHAGRTGEDG